MPLRRIVTAIFTILVMLVSIIGWFAVDYSLDTVRVLGGDAGTTKTLVVMWVLSVVIVAALGLFLDRTVIRPLLTLKDNAKAIGAGHPPPIREKYSETEIGDLQEAIDQMAESLASREAELEGNERRLRNIFDAVLDGILLADIEQHRFVMGNPAICRMLGYTEDEIKTIGIEDIHPADDMPMVAEAIEKQVSNEQPLAEDIPMLRKDGSVFYADINATPVSLGGRPLLMGVFRDITEAKRAQEELLRSTEKLRELEFIVDHSPAVFFLWKAAEGWPVEFVTDNVRQFGYTPEDFYSGRVPYASIVHADDLERVGKEVAAYSADPSRREFSQEYRIVSPDGRVSTTDDRTWIRRNDQGEITHYQGIIFDITARKTAEQALQESEQQLKEAQRLSHLGSWTLDLVTNELRWSDEAYRICEIDAAEAELTYETFLSLVHPDDRTSVDKTFRESVEKHTPYDIEHRLLMKDGRVKWINERGRTEYDEQGAPILTTGTALDITERKAAEAKLQETMQGLELFRSALDRSSDAILVTDVETSRFIDVNETACTMLGYGRDELLNMKVADIETEFPDDTSWRQYMETVRRSDGMVFRGKTLRKDGSVFPNEVSMKVTSVDGNEVVIAILRDISERIETERALRYAQKVDALGNLAGGIAHNMNNLLLPILSLTDMTLKDLPEESRARKRMEKVVQAAEEGKALVQQIMDFSRRSTENGQEEERDLRDAIVEALDLVMVSVPSSIDVVQDLGPPGLRAVIDRDQITTAIMNVVSNAVDAFNGGVGTLRISLTQEDVNARTASRVPGLHPGNYAKLTIADTGTGMDEKTMERVFDPFFTTKEVGEGKGLGLATVRSIVEKLKGTISISSTPDAGTTVTIYLPVVDGAPSSQS